MRLAFVLGTGCLLFAICSASAQDKPTPLPQNGFVGEWVNANKDARGLRRLVVSNKGDAWSIEAWGAGGSGEIPWKEVRLALLGDNAAAKSLPYGFATWEFGFATAHLTLRAEKDELVAETFTIFKDNSGRSNFRAVEKFKMK